jgi:hypothetical protein
VRVIPSPSNCSSRTVGFRIVLDVPWRREGSDGGDWWWRKLARASGSGLTQTMTTVSDVEVMIRRVRGYSSTTAV